jgi:hypothetical protein
MSHRRKPLSPATVEHLNHILRACAERAEQRNAELAAEKLASEVLAVAIELARAE